jgi:hypothetical protein
LQLQQAGHLRNKRLLKAERGAKKTNKPLREEDIKQITRKKFLQRRKSS